MSAIEKTTSMPTKPNVPSKSTSLHRPASSQQVWTCLKNDGKFMNALTSFMNESWVTVSQAREKSGLNPNYEISDEELSRKIEDISFRLRMKYKEVATLESQKARLLKKSVESQAPEGQGPAHPAASLTLAHPVASSTPVHSVASSTPEQLPGRLVSEQSQSVGPSISGRQHPEGPLSDHPQPVGPPPSVKYPGGFLPGQLQPGSPPPSAQYPGGPFPGQFQPVGPPPSMQYPRQPRRYPGQYPSGPPGRQYRQIHPGSAAQYPGYGDTSYSAGSGRGSYFGEQQQLSRSQSGSRGYGYPPACIRKPTYNSSGGYQSFGTDI
ncbi:basic salivary proline-rich protein 1-like isoform X2 [Sitophilus oryzae]|uniref:Basic salivary proline-rich protein 1-like isoform X2 n=1 Tax=Sitophilus oryzae TaxID=7048 RepID=A0A6J2YRP8_SITOR|nr:basic salivary proline-rich protein 1-like isoform X2 [Sitophilus oryzae]